jgi:hypothetical protein
MIALAFLFALLAAVLPGIVAAPVQACPGCTHSFCNTCTQSHQRCGQVSCQCVCLPPI